ncbi:hypothetical protein SARC_05468 [Sphaeroforma arctica JP610]|uniref:60S acidic ribosomal protein P1 n=1 Tax=Sphaeroforma arctica JP610 TaxID=667725 RepID=A0A0L0FZJ3_9EUKA|nr:hypothetical protein SARC_05468 [Sphaeroforma arctica JP610]KNC82240.1 hypothetical protein SARC_05468 [Sphaeroforma arctica JP610]|eukprot:XP_014156142.1 hypothetical protein SARC_05468 [Sphaeroforma arctica JP610]
MSIAELACSYAALILHDDDAEISTENIEKIVSAAGVKIDSYWYGLFSKALSGSDVNQLLSAVGSASAGPAAGAAPASGDAPAAAEKAAEPEPEEESEEEDMGFGLFD